jgi:hypothetical protein
MPQEKYIENFMGAIDSGASATTAFAIVQTGLNFMLSGLISQFLGMINSLQMIFI